MTKVSFFSNIKQSSGGQEVELDDIITSIQIGEYKDAVEQIRATEDKKKQSELKRRLLPYFTGSGVFTERNKNGLKQHNGRIVIDLDKLDDVNRAKEKLKGDPFIEYIFVSCGGKGLAVIFKIDPGKHDQSFEAIASYIQHKYGFEVDIPVKDVSRARFVSYDPDLFHNREAREFKVSSKGDVYDVDRIKRIAEVSIQRAIAGEKHYTLLRASRLLGGFAAGGLIDEDEARDHLRYCVQKYLNPEAFVTHYQTVEDGLKHGGRFPITAESAAEQDAANRKHLENIREIYSFAHQVNRAGRQWTDEDVKKLGENYGVDATKVKEVFNKVFVENKDEFGLDDAPEIEKVEVFLRRNFEFYYNEVTQIREHRENGSDGPLIRVNYDSVFRLLQKSGFKFPLDKLKSLLRSDFVPTYNPFVQYFERLPKWVKTDEDHIDKLASYVETNEQEFWRVQFKKALVRMIHCALDSYVNRIVVVLVSETQSTGKSTFIRFLNPFGLDYYTESPLSNDKDTEFAFAENFIYNLEELSSLNNTDINRLKAIISKSSIKERKPYSTDAESHPRRCTFWGSTNKLEFLTDSHNTRWLCFTVKSIKWGYTKEVDIHKVMSQAFALYKDPSFVYELTPDEQEKRDFLNKDFEVTDHEKELIILNFKRCPKDSGTFMTNSEIYQVLTESTDGKAKLKQNFISKSMVQLGFIRDTKKINGHTARGFWVIMSQQATKVTDLNQDKPLEVRIATAKKEDDQVKSEQGTLDFDGSPLF